MNDLQRILGCILVAVLCAWAVWFSVKEIRERLDSGTAVDRTLSVVDREDNPRLFYLQIWGFALLAAGTGVISVVAVGMALRTLFGTP